MQHQKLILYLKFAILVKQNVILVINKHQWPFAQYLVWDIQLIKDKHVFLIVFFVIKQIQIIVIIAVLASILVILVVYHVVILQDVYSVIKVMYV